MDGAVAVVDEVPWLVEAVPVVMDMPVIVELVPDWPTMLYTAIALAPPQL
jgi:hypothetical protein